MIIISEVVYDEIDDYVNYLISSGETTQKRAFVKRDLMIHALRSSLGSIVTHRLSPYVELGNDTGCLLYVYKDPKSKTQWGFAYKRFDNHAIVYYMKNLKLVKYRKDY